jgi:hypothetical protein
MFALMFISATRIIIFYLPVTKRSTNYEFVNVGYYTLLPNIQSTIVLLPICSVRTCGDCELGLSRLVQDPMEGSCEHGNEPMDIIKGGGINIDISWIIYL